ncbi:MAG: LTA synthase family protein [Bacilli bacterium]|nr:LTA synthase family protein [Bacilli bacterium]
MEKIDKVIELLKKIRKEYPVTVFYVVANLINAILLRLFTTGSFGIRALFIDIGFVLLLASLSLVVNKKRRNLYYWFTSLFMVACCVVNAIYYNYYSSFVSFSLLATSVFVKDVGDAVIDFAIKPTDWIYLWEFIGLYIVIKKYKIDFKIYKDRFLKLLGIAIISIGIGCAIPPYNSFSRLIKLWNRVSVVNNFGVYVYQIDDLVQSLKPTFNNLFGYDKALKETKEYYQENSNIQSVNKYTGIFEGKNVIAIHAESLQSFALDLSFNDKEVTPNLNKLIDSGMYFSNFYAQVGVGTSSDTEFTYATSLLPANNGTVFVNYYNNRFETIQNLLNNKGYYVFSMHGNVGDFWNRDIMHINMGYDKFYSKSSFVIDEEYGLGLSDDSFFRQVVPMIKEINSQGIPYYGTLITLTNHTPWRDANEYSDYEVIVNKEVSGEEITNDYLEDLAIGKYLKSVNYMDRAIGSFIENMDKEGLLDNTVIVIYGDHDARLGKKQFEYLYNYDIVNNRIYDEDDNQYTEFNEYDYELSKKVPFIIWSKDMDMDKGIEIDTPMGMIDAGVTLGNMLNIHNKYALGQDIMNIKKEDGIVVFKDGSYITDKIYYSAKNNESYTINSGVIKDDYIRRHSEYADKIIEISDSIITYDLLKDIEK